MNYKISEESKKIVEIICAERRVGIKDIMTRRNYEAVRAKKIIYKLFQILGYSTTQIGNMFGVDHTSVMSGIKSLQKFPDLDREAFRYAEIFSQEGVKAYDNRVRQRIAVEARKKDIVKLANEGKSISQIAEQLNFDEELVNGVLEYYKKNNLLRLRVNYSTGKYFYEFCEKCC